MESYHTNESSAIGADESLARPIVGTARETAWINPYALPLPAIGRLLEFIWKCGTRGALIETSNRDLALAIRCSAGLLPDLLDRLEADGYITCLPHTRGTMIEVLR